jgi:type III pantothenate kinase
MLLAIDIGNTLIDFGVFEKDRLVSVYKTSSNSAKSVDEYESVVKVFVASRKLDPFLFDGVIISSVVPALTAVFGELSEKVFLRKPIFVGPHLKTGLRLKVDHPQEVGADLVCDSVGGVALYGAPLFIADLGTANKYLFIDETGAYAGLSIAPGVAVSLSALVNKAAALPEVPLVIPEHAIGKNTMDCMASGITYGTAYQIEGFAASFEKESGLKLKRLLTGGNAIYVKKLLPDFAYDEGLTLKGLAAIYRRVNP